MEYISSFMYCTIDAQGDREILSSITPDYIPGNYSFNAHFSVVGFEVGKDYLLKLDFKGPTGNQIFSTEEQRLDNPNREEGENPMDRQWGIKINFEYKNVPLEKEGLYITTVYSNNESLGSFAIPVFKGGDKNE